MAAVEQPLLLLNPPEIIDVDLFDDEDDIRTSDRPFQRRRISPPNSILVLDSDEEGGQFTPNSRNRNRNRIDEEMHRRRRLSRSRRIFSPPPPLQDRTIPPVPPLPRTLPVRRRAPPFPTGVVRTNSQPFPFEADIRMQPQRRRDSVTTASPLSQHQPVMGFGGAILTQHNRAGGGGGASVGFIRQSINYVSDVLHRFTGLPPVSSNATPEPPAPPPNPHSHGQDELFAFLAHGGAYDFGRSRMRDRKKEEIEYKPSYTHPGKAAVGYSYDFAPDEEPSSTQIETTLVCARCLDPLVVGGLGAGAGIKGRMWGLRCGHVLDGTCVAEIMRPPAGEDAMWREEVETSKVSKAKGKGKAKAVDTPMLVDGDAHPLSIRSRLRPRSNLSFVPQIPAAILRSSLKRKRDTTPKLLARHHWYCPVNGCGRVHVSVQYQGETEWAMDNDMGAVGIYV
jgi:hypothetical protein